MKESPFKFGIRNYLLNFGPQHPAAHGVLRLVLELDGEVVERADPQIGLLHRGVEKLVELCSYRQAVPYFDRLDYMSMMCEEYCYALAVESLLGGYVSTYAQYFRVMLSEMTRILNHLMALTSHAMDVGALTPFLWGFEEREKLLEIFERISGAYMHVATLRPGMQEPDNLLGLTTELFADIARFLQEYHMRINEMEELLTGNRIWKQRLVDIGVVSIKEALAWGFSGVLLRGSGVAWDLRKMESYDVYDQLSFDIPVGSTGDCFDRYLVRIEELRQSWALVGQCVSVLTSIGKQAFVAEGVSKCLASVCSKVENSMESLIHHYKVLCGVIGAFSGECYQVVEAPKGEFGVFLVSAGFGQAVRCRIKSPGFLHLQGLDCMVRGHLVADVVTVVGTQDIVFGEIDR